jgi:hypothetical protein
MTNTNTNTPGKKGATRSTWRDAKHLRGLLLALIRHHPKATRDDLEKLYLAAVKGPEFYALPEHEALIDEALRRCFDNDLARIEQPATRSPRHTISAAEVTDAALRVAAQAKKLILLDWIMPNGKALRDCSGAECRAAAGWLIKIADRIGDDAVVGAKLGEAEVAAILAAGADTSASDRPRRRRASKSAGA